VRREGRLANRQLMKGQKTLSCWKPSWTEGQTEDAETGIGLTDHLRQDQTKTDSMSP
jgi:hypothetical protein